MTIFDLLDSLRNRSITGHAAMGLVNDFIKSNGYKAEILLIIDRNLQTRVTASLISDEMPDLLPKYEVALGKDYDKENKKPDLTNEDWLSSRKMDGCRAVAFIDANGDTVFKSRDNNEFKTFGKVAVRLKAMGFKNVILDGEMCLINPDGSDDFNGMQKQFSKKNHTIENPRYRIFDQLTTEEFWSRTSTTKLSDRIKRFTYHSFDDMPTDGMVLPIEQKLFKSQVDFETYRELAASMKWEGLILRKDCPYEGKRSARILKVKNFKEAEFIVVGAEITSQRIIQNGKEVTRDLFGAAIIEFEGFQVNVGSGYTLDERIEFADKSKIIGKEITVKYFETSQNKKGESSLRFPTFKCIKERF